MVNSTCFVPGCKTGYASDKLKRKREGKKNPSLFTPPRDAALFELWKLSIPRADQQVTRRCRVCELHFSEDDIERFYVTKLKDGSISRIEKGRPLLKFGAIPKILPNISKYLAKIASKTVSEPSSASQTQVSTLSSASETQASVVGIESKMQPPTYHYSKDKSLKINHPASEQNEKILDRKKYLNAITMENFLNGIAAEENVNVDLPNLKTEVFTFSTLLEDIHAIKIPCDLWGITQTANFVICAKWDSVCVPERRVIIENNLGFKIFLKEKQVCGLEIKEITSINDVSCLLERVDRLKICEGAGDRTVERCRGCLPERSSSRGNYSHLCKYCQINRKQEWNAFRRLKQPVIARTRLHQRIVCAERKHIQLKHKVKLLKAELEAAKKLCEGTKTKRTDGTVSNLPWIITLAKAETNFSSVI